MDIRFERSEKFIRQAFLTLLEERANHNITVSEICRRAECSRNTFYLHYDSKEHLLSTIIDELVEKIEESCQPVVKQFKYIGPTESKMFTDQILLAIEENKSIIRSLFSQEHWQFSKRLFQVLLDSQINEAIRLNQPYNNSHLVYFTSGIVGYIQFWLSNDWPITKAQEELYQAIHFSFQ